MPDLAAILAEDTPPALSGLAIQGLTADSRKVKPGFLFAALPGSKVDGGEFGFGAEIGISTQKLHARGPMGLPEMTSTKYVVIGDGHIR